MSTFALMQTETDDEGVATMDGIIAVSAPIGEDGYHVWPDDAVIEAEAARMLKWDVARMIDSEVGDKIHERTFRFVRFYEWTVKIRVAALWVADGFDLDSERAHDMVRGDLGHATSVEVETEIVKAPDPKSIRIEQGEAA